MFNQTGQSSVHLLKQVYHMTQQIAHNDMKTIWQVSHLYTGDVSVAKTQHLSQSNANQRSVLHQGRFLQNCQGSPGIPFLVWCGKDQIQKMGILIQEKLGKSLLQLLNQQKAYNQLKQKQKNNQKLTHHQINIHNSIITNKYSNLVFSLKTLTMISLQLLKMLSCYHQKGYLFRNLSLRTLQFGISSRCDKLYFNDFIDSRSFYKKNTFQHIDKKINIKFKKINQFMSYDVLNGIEPGRKDDMEAMMYVILCLANGNLPWGRLFQETDERKDGYVIVKKNKNNNNSNNNNDQMKSNNNNNNNNNNRQSSISSNFKPQVKYSNHCLQQKIKYHKLNNFSLYSIQKKAQTIRQLHSFIPSRQLFCNLPIQFLQIYEQIKSLSFTDRPNYSLYLLKLQSILIKNNWQNDHVYDWMKYDRIEKEVKNGGLSIKQLEWLVYKPNKNKKEKEKEKGNNHNNRNQNNKQQQQKQDNNNNYDKYDDFNKLSKLDNQDQILKIYQKYAPYTGVDKFNDV